MVSETVKRLALNGGAIFSNNLGGIVYGIKNSQGNSALDQGFDQYILTPMNITGTAAKAVKTLLYDLIALGALEATQGKSQMVQVAGAYGAEFAKGLGTSTLAADPTYVNAVPGAQSERVQSTPPAPPPRISNAIM